MTDTLRIAVSGLTAASRTVQAAASNIANASSQNFQPVQSVASSQVAGPASAGVLASFAPAGLPEVNIEANIISLQTASAAYSANAAVIRTENERTEALLQALDIQA